MPSYFLRCTGVGTILDSGPQITASWEITVLIPEAEVAHIRKMVLADFMYLHRHQLTIRVATVICQLVQSINRSRLDTRLPVLVWVARSL